MFHGPRLQAVRRMERNGDNGALATLVALPRRDLVAGFGDEAYVIDPILLDAAGQAVAFWVLENFDRSVDIFPYSLGTLRFFGPPPPVGRTLACRVLIESMEETRMSSDIELLDAEGVPWCRFTAWEDRRFDLPKSFIRLRHSPETGRIAHPWSRTNQPLPAAGEGNTSCMRIDDEHAESLFEAHAGIWARMLSHLVLGRQERALWSDLQTAVPKRRREWLLGRCAAKDAVRSLVRQAAGLDLCPADVEILPDPHGRPTVQGPWLPRLGLAMEVSIAHTDGLVMAMASGDPGIRVGIDAEPVRTLEAGFETLAFTREERDLLDRHPGEGETARCEWALRFWCAREAAFKAVGGRIEGGNIRVAEADFDSGAVTLRMAQEPLARSGSSAARSIVAQTIRDQTFIIATTEYPTGGDL
jgi:4'-phosphopantetheinyl transferase EntD